jgi:Uma2 family endonuclease
MAVTGFDDGKQEQIEPQPLEPFVYTQAAEGLPRRKFSMAEIERMVECGIFGEDERFELIGGELVMMSPKGIRHEVVKVALNEHLVRHLPHDCQTAPETTFRIDEYNFLEPDFVVFPRDGLAELSPDTVLLVVEIADSSLAYDQGRKAAIYARIGVRELWVIDVKRNTVRVHKDLHDGSYDDIVDHGSEDTIAPAFAPGFSLNLAELALE